MHVGIKHAQLVSVLMKTAGDEINAVCWHRVVTLTKNPLLGDYAIHIIQQTHH